MKIGRIDRAGEPHLGVVVGPDDNLRVLDLTAVTQVLGVPHAERFASMRSLILAGVEGLDEARNVLDQAQGMGDQHWLPIAQVRWLVPVEKPSNFLCAGRNFRKHRDESAATWSKAGVQVAESDIPTGFVKLPGTLMPDGAEVVRPANVSELDYEVEIAAVIGRSALNISPSQALDHVFGYTIFNDLSAREWQRREMRNQMLMVGKNFPGFGPVGPWILTADEVPDPASFVLELRVNGELRQHSSAESMIFSFPQLIAFWSQVDLQPGDLIASGTPDGVATHHKPDPAAWYLRPGDRVEASVLPIGVLRTVIC